MHIYIYIYLLFWCFDESVWKQSRVEMESEDAVCIANADAQVKYTSLKNDT